MNTNKSYKDLQYELPWNESLPKNEIKPHSASFLQVKEDRFPSMFEWIHPHGAVGGFRSQNQSKIKR